MIYRTYVQDNPLKWCRLHDTIPIFVTDTFYSLVNLPLQRAQIRKLPQKDRDAGEANGNLQENFH